MDKVDQEKVNQVVHEMSKNSRCVVGTPAQSLPLERFTFLFLAPPLPGITAMLNAMVNAKKRKLLKCKQPWPSCRLQNVQGLPSGFQK